MPLKLIQGDITKTKVDAIVNAANSRLAPGGGVCGAIFSAAGYTELDKACRAIGGCETGKAAITPGFELPAKYIIHAVGPIWQGGGRGEEQQLKSAYTTSLMLAYERGCRSIAFPLISSGIYGYPKDKALADALDAINSFLEDRDILVYLVLFDKAALEMGKKLISATQVVAALIWKGDKFLACQRPFNKKRGLLWEFVGGKVEPGETKEQALIRECMEELGITILPKSVFMEVRHEYPDLTIELTVFNAIITDGIPQKLEHNDIRWISPNEIEQFDFCPADESILERLKNL